MTIEKVLASLQPVYGDLVKLTPQEPPKNSVVRISYHPEGHPLMKGRRNMQQNKVGYWEYSTENGQLESCGFYDNDGREEKNGQWLEFYPNRKLKSITEYQNDKPESYTEFHFSTPKSSPTAYAIKTSGQHLDGQKNGEWKTFHNNGALANIKIYDMDKLIDEKVTHQHNKTPTNFFPKIASSKADEVPAPAASMEEFLNNMGKIDQKKLSSNPDYTCD